MYRNSVNFMKITTEFTNFGCEFCLISRQNMSLNSTVQLRLRWFLQGFLGGCTQKTGRVFWVCTKVCEP